MSVFQIWGSFTKDDPDHPTTVSTFRKGQMMFDGTTTMEQFDRDFATKEGEDFRLLYEFDVIERLAQRDIHEHHPSEKMETAIAFAIADAYMQGWFHLTEEEDADDQDEH